MRSDRYYMLSFSSTHAAIAAQRQLQDRVPVHVMPTLRAVQAGCGISLRVEEVNLAALGQALPLLGNEGWQLFLVQGEGNPHVIRVDL